MTRQQALEDVRSSTVPARTPRLRLKPKAHRSGYVDGAWWPHSVDLAVELPDLLAVLSVRLGRIDRVMYNMRGWAKVPRKLVTGGRAVRLDGYRRQPINTIEVLGLGHDRIVLMVVPPNTDPTHAHATMMAAAEPNNASTVDNLLAINVDERRRRTTVAAAQERWESEGGMLLTSRLG